MPLVNALCTLADIKTLAGISGNDQDARLELLINQTSAQIASYCNRKFARANYDETYSPSDRQLLILRQMPVVSVSAITSNGVALTDYVLSPEYANNGFLYRELGWNGEYINRSYLTDDPVATRRNLNVKYTAGYYLPGDIGYVPGSADSLPLDLQFVCQEMTLAVYMQARRNNWDGLQSMTEDGLSYTWGSQATNNSSGLFATYAGILNKYRRLAVAA